MATTYPHISIIHPNGTIVAQFSGYRSDQQLLQELTDLEELPLLQMINENQVRNAELQ